MAVWNLGSINIDRFYSVPHFPAPGETLAATNYSEGLGGKGANMSVAVARAGARVSHIGAVGKDGLWARDRLLEYGVDTRPIATMDTSTGHANINLDSEGENQIVLFAGANRQISSQQIQAALANATTGDTLLMQNESNGQVEAATIARQLGLRIVYAAAPFDADAARAMLERSDILVLNDVEAQQLEMATGSKAGTLAVPHVVVTKGSAGAIWYDTRAEQAHPVSAYPTKVVDTTGAGDTFTGYFVAGLDRGMPMAQALDLAARAAALMVARKGTADVIPDLKDLEDARFA